MRSPEHEREGQGTDRAAISRFECRERIEFPPLEKTQHRWIIHQPARVRDMVTNERDPVVPAEEQGALGGQVPAAGGGVHPADPGAEREADDSEGEAGIGMETIVKYLLEAYRDRKLIGNETRPKRRRAGRTRRDGDHVASIQAPLPAKRREWVRARAHARPVRGGHPGRVSAQAACR